MRTALAAALSLIALAEDASAQSRSDPWLIHIEANSASVMFADTSRIEQRPANVRRAWAWRYYGADNVDHHSAILGDYDCAEHRFRGVQSTRYSRNGQSATIPGEADWSYVIPDTVVDHVWRFVCATDAQRTNEPDYAQLSAQRSPMTMDQAAAALLYVR